MIKNKLRQQHLTLRQAMDQKDVLKKSRKIVSKIMQMAEVQQADTIFSYNAFRNEVILDPVMLNGWQVALPQVINKEAMVFRIIDMDTVFKKSSYGVLEPVNGTVITPTSKSVVLVPGSVFDLDGHRIGYGGGYYDRYLAKHPESLRIGVCYKDQLEGELTASAHDVTMQRIVTE